MKKTTVKIILTAVALTLTGCGSKKKDSYIEPTISGYTRETYDTVELKQGDLQPEFTIKISAPEAESVTYYPSYDGMKIEKVYVDEGDIVKKGDVLITFVCDDFDDQIEDYNSRVTQDQILIDHYNELAKINTDVDYTRDIEALQNDIEVSNMYLAELYKKKEAYTIKAKKDGSVKRLGDATKMVMTEGIDIELDSNVNLITVNYGDGIVVGETEEDYDFEEGQKYTAVYGLSEYPVELIEIEEMEDKKTLTFKGCDSEVDYTSLSEAKIVLQRPVLKNVSYIETECVFYISSKSYVYIVDENGFREPRPVEVGKEVGDYIVIKSGIEPGEKVVID